MEIRRTPGYPLLLTLGVLADRIAAVTIAVQILLGTATVWMVALLARRVIGAGTGVCLPKTSSPPLCTLGIIEDLASAC